MIVDFTAPVFRWQARSDDWYFVALPAELSDDIREIPRPPRGFGAVAVRVQVGSSSWRTSIFPDAERGAYVLPLKRSVRIAEGIADDGVVAVRLEILDS